MVTTDDILIKGCLIGDRKSQQTLYEKYKVPMFRVCLRYAQNRAEAEDMLQEGFIKVFSDMHQFRSDGVFAGWIRRVIVNVALMHIRKRKNLFTSDEVENLANDVVADDHIMEEMNVKALTKLIQQLPPGYRAVFNMFVIEGYSHKEIAAQMGISENTSKSQLSKAKAFLRKMLEKIMAD